MAAKCALAANQATDDDGQAVYPALLGYLLQDQLRTADGQVFTIV